MLIQVAEYRPDVADLNTAFTDDVLNVLPADGGYIPMAGFSDFTQAFPEKPLGAFAVRSLDGGVFVFAGTTTKLYTLNATDQSWTDVSKEDTAYSASEDARWSFAVFGDYVIAVNQNNNPQVFQIGKDEKFRDLAGNPPRAGMVRVWGDFVCLMCMPDMPNGVQWSGLGDAEFWTPGQRNSDIQIFPDGGTLQGSSEATNPIIFMQNAIYLGTFIPGSKFVFSFQKIQDKRGAKSPYSIACRGAFTFYADEGGFFQIGGDGSLNPIGFEKVDRTIFTKLNASNISDMIGVIDPFYSRVYWAMDYNGTGIYNEMLVYDWGLGRWSLVQIRATAIMPIYTEGYTLDGLDAVSTNVDALPFSLDSKAWQGGAPILGAFSPDLKLGSFSAANMEATITTQEFGATNGQVNRTEQVYPVVDTDQVFVSVGVRMRRNQYEPVTWLSEQVPSYNTGLVRKRSRARFHRFRMRIPAGETWSHAKGFDVDFIPAGFR